MRQKGRGTVTLRADGRWQLARTMPNGTRRYLYVRGTLKEADAKLAEWLRSSDVVLSPDSSLSSFLRRWLVEVEGTVRPATFRHYEMIVRVHLEPGLGKVRLSALTPQLIGDYLREKAKAPRTLHHHLAVLRRSLRLAQGWRLIDWNPARLVDAPASEDHEPTVLTVPQIRRLLQFTRDDRWAALWALAVDSGMRQAELLGLTWSAIDLDAGFVRAERQLARRDGAWAFAAPKTEAGVRSVAIQPSTVAALRTHWARQMQERLALGVGTGDSLVFTTEKGHPVHANVVVNAFHRALEAAGLPRVRFHDLRHASATWALAAGASLEDVKRRLGHSSIRVTSDVYGHHVAERQRGVADAMSRLLEDVG